ncbi:hypothetical protein GH714_033352 [Hevea brasiliensis]|uniref:Uncharacterized protein n=1 Tax=Hevea brasiliensis TaxID=3981 RepID=A0A6A6L2Q0_HEVBR|nr:hypothetical protein GH714_033352 [Hevea brasiliensis]
MEKLTFCCMLLLSLVAISRAKFPDDHHHLPLPRSTFPSVQAGKLIRELNLFPAKDVNVLRDGDAGLLDGRNRIVEKRFRFPNVVDDEFGGVSVEDLGHHAGYYKIANSHAARMFYFFFESRNSKKDPVVIWLTGGPGVAASNLLYVDQPIGTGFSFSSDIRDIRHNEQGVSNDLYDFLQGFAIGNGLTDPAIQYGAYTDYALDMGLIKQSDYNRINKVLPVCEMAIKLCGTDGTVSCMASYFVCNSIFSSIMSRAGDINYYDIRKKCEGSLCYDFSNLEKFLNLKSVRDSLGVGDISFVSCSPTVYQAMLMDWMRNLEAGIPALLEDGIKLLVYAGEYDLICNWLGNSRWVHAMEWSGQKDFVASSEVPFEVDGSEAGVLRSHGPLAFLKVNNAGHMVPMDQPKASLEMLKRWTHGKLSEGTAYPEKLMGKQEHNDIEQDPFLEWSIIALKKGIPSELIEDSKFVPLNADDPVYGPPALLLMGFELDEALKIRQLLKELGGEFLQVIFCTEDMIPQSLWEAMHTSQPNLETVQIAKSLPRICILSGLSGEEMMMFIDAFPETGLEAAAFAALVPNSANKPLQELIDEIMGDHEMLENNPAHHRREQI